MKENPSLSKTRFDAQTAAAWDDNPVRVELASCVASAIERNVSLRPDLAAMEFGCGTGLVSALLSPRVGRITAIDSSRDMLDVLQRKIEEHRISNITPLCIDLCKESCSGERFDLIYSSMAMHHVEQMEPLLAVFHSLLKSHGILALADLDREDGAFHPDPRGVFHHGFDRDPLKDKLARAGFANISFTTGHRFQKPNSRGVLTEYSVFLVTAEKAR